MQHICCTCWSVHLTGSIAPRTLLKQRSLKDAHDLETQALCIGAQALHRFMSRDTLSTNSIHLLDTSVLSQQALTGNQHELVSAFQSLVQTLSSGTHVVQLYVRH